MWSVTISPAFSSNDRCCVTVTEREYSTLPSKLLINIYRAFHRSRGQLLYKQIDILHHTTVLLLDRLFREYKRQNAPQASVVRSVSTENTVYVLEVALSKGCSLAA